MDTSQRLVEVKRSSSALGEGPARTYILSLPNEILHWIFKLAIESEPFGRKKALFVLMATAPRFRHILLYTSDFWTRLETEGEQYDWNTGLGQYLERSKAQANLDYSLNFSLLNPSQDAVKLLLRHQKRWERMDFYNLRRKHRRIFSDLSSATELKRLWVTSSSAALLRNIVNTLSSQKLEHLRLIIDTIDIDALSIPILHALGRLSTLSHLSLTMPLGRIGKAKSQHKKEDKEDVGHVNLENLVDLDLSSPFCTRLLPSITAPKLVKASLSVRQSKDIEEIKNFLQRSQPPLQSLHIWIQGNDVFEHNTKQFEQLFQLVPNLRSLTLSYTEKVLGNMDFKDLFLETESLLPKLTNLIFDISVEEASDAEIEEVVRIVKLRCTHSPNTKIQVQAGFLLEEFEDGEYENVRDPSNTPNFQIIDNSFLF